MPIFDYLYIKLYFQDDQKLSSCYNTSCEDEFVLVKGKGTSKMSSPAKFLLQLSNKFEFEENEEADDDPINFDFLYRIATSSSKREKKNNPIRIITRISKKNEKAKESFDASVTPNQLKVLEDNKKEDLPRDNYKIDDSNVIDDKNESAVPRIRCRSCQIRHFPYPKFCRWAKEASVGSMRRQ